MKRIENLKKNFEVIKTEPLTKEEFARIMQFKWLLYYVLSINKQLFHNLRDQASKFFEFALNLLISWGYFCVIK
jgi:hypothetical protein